MPTGTFFRLPEEKRERLVEAAWEEFTRVPFGEASINRIIRAANIPRGSFYQYFANKKEDLLVYLLDDTRDYFSGIIQQGVLEAEGDLFALALDIYDRMGAISPQADGRLRRCVKLLRINPEVMMHSIMTRNHWDLPRSLAAQIDTSRFCRRDEEFVVQVCLLTLFSLGAAAVDTMHCPQRREKNREQLRIRLDILRRGAEGEPHQAAKESSPQEFAPAGANQF